MNKQKITVTPEQTKLMIYNHLYQIIHQAQKQNKMPPEVERPDISVKKRLFSKKKPAPDQLPEEDIHKIVREMLNHNGPNDPKLSEYVFAIAARGAKSQCGGIECLDPNTYQVGNQIIKIKANLPDLTSRLVDLSFRVDKNITIDHVPESLSDFVNMLPNEYRSNELVKLASDFDLICTTQQFKSPAEMERMIGRFRKDGIKRDEPPAMQILAYSEALQNGMYIEWARELAKTDGETAILDDSIAKMENHVLNGKEAYYKIVELVKARDGDTAHHQMLVAESKNQISLEFYYNLQRIVDACGGFGHDTIKDILDGKLTHIDKPDLKLICDRIQGEISKLEREIAEGKSAEGELRLKLGKKFDLPLIASRKEKMHELQEKLLRYQTIYSDDNLAGVNEAIKWVRERMTGSMVDFYMIGPKDVKIRKGQTYTRLDVPLATSEYKHGFAPVVEKELGRLRKDGYVKAMIYDRFYLQNLTALNKIIGGLAAGTIGMGVLDLVTGISVSAASEGVKKGVESFMKTATGGGANFFNGWADMVSGGVLLGRIHNIKLDDGRIVQYRPGIIQAQQEHASKAGLGWGIIGGTVFALGNSAYGIFGLKGEHFSMLQKEIAAGMHAASGNFTTQTVGAAVLMPVYKEAKLLADAGVMKFNEAKNMFAKGLVALGVFKNLRNATIFGHSVAEVYWHNIFRRWQTVRGSAALWGGILGLLGPLGIVAHPGALKKATKAAYILAAALPLSIIGMARAYKRVAAENERENVWKQLKRNPSFIFNAAVAGISAAIGAGLAAVGTLFTVSIAVPLGGMALFLFAVLETPMAAVGIKIQPWMNKGEVSKSIRKVAKEIDSKYTRGN